MKSKLEAIYQLNSPIFNPPEIKEPSPTEVIYGESPLLPFIKVYSEQQDIIKLIRNSLNIKLRRK